MNLSFMDNESKVAPLLVRLYDSERISSSSLNKNSEIKLELSDAVCELMEQELSPREAELVADVMIGMMRRAELDFRKALAQRLAALENVPLRLVLNMASDDIEVAGSVLRESAVLTDIDLIYIVKSKGAEHWRQIARRQGLGEKLQGLLVEMGDEQTAINLAENEKIIIPAFVLETLSDMAKRSDALAVPLLRREEVSPEMARSLFQFVGSEVKNYISQEYGIHGGEIAKAVDDVLLDFVDATKDEDDLTPTSGMLSDAMRQYDKGLITTKTMLGTLRRGQLKLFIAQFSIYTDLDVKAVIEIVGQTSGQGLAIACKAYNINKEDFMSIFLLSNRARNNGQMIEINQMSKAMEYFTKVSQEMALNIIRNSKL